MEDRQLHGSTASAISTRMVQLMSRYTGRGPTKARTTINTNVVVVVLQDTLTRGEENLVLAGDTAAVLTMRRTFHEMLRQEAVECVEQALDRTVQAFLADVDPVANVAALVFCLEHEPETGKVEVDVTSDSDGG